MNHPAGRIGKRLILRVRDVMLTGSSLPLIGPNVFIMEVRPSHIFTLRHTKQYSSVLLAMSLAAGYTLQTAGVSICMCLPTVWRQDARC